MRIGDMCERGLMAFVVFGFLVAGLALTLGCGAYAIGLESAIIFMRTGAGAVAVAVLSGAANVAVAVYRNELDRKSFDRKKEGSK